MYVLLAQRQNKNEHSDLLKLQMNVATLIVKMDVYYQLLNNSMSNLPRPRAATSVATSMGVRPSRKSNTKH